MGGCGAGGRVSGSGPVLGDGAGGMRQTHLGQYAMLGEARGEGVEVLQGLLFPRVLAWQQGEGAAVGTVASTGEGSRDGADEVGALIRRRGLQGVHEEERCTDLAQAHG